MRDEIEKAFPTLRIAVLKRFLAPWLFRYAQFDGTEQCIWDAALRNIPLSHRYLGRSLTVKDLDRLLGSEPRWKSIREAIQPRDRISPSIREP